MIIRTEKIIITGVSTASDYKHDIYDYSFEGSDISNSELTNKTIVTDVTHEEAIEHLKKVT